MGGAGKHAKLCPGYPNEVAWYAPAQKPEHLDGVFGPNDVGITDDQQGAELQPRELVSRPRLAGTVELIQFDDKRCPRIRIGCNSAVGLMPSRPVELVRVERLEGRSELRIQPARIEGHAAEEHETVHQLGVIEGQLEADRAAHAVAHDISARNVQLREQGCRVAGHVLVTQLPIDVPAATVALQLDGDHLELARERRQQSGEAALDRPEGTMEQHKWRAVAVALVVQLKLTQIDIARAIRARQRLRRAIRPALPAPVPPYRGRGRNRAPSSSHLWRLSLRPLYGQTSSTDASEYLGDLSYRHSVSRVKRRRTILIGYDAAELLDIACVTTSLHLANLHGARPQYDVRLATPGGRPISCATDLTLHAHEALERIFGSVDTLVVSGGTGHRAAADNAVIVGHVRRLARQSRRIVSVCTGATVLAAAGLLDGRRATTHWDSARELAKNYPEVSVDPDPIFIRDGNVSTSAGVSCALDLTLALIEEDHGAEVARDVARMLVTYLQRPGNQAQMSMFTMAPPPSNGLVKQIVDHVMLHLDADLSAGTLADRAGVSERHLTRLFLKDLGQAPGRFVRQARTEAAANLLVSTDLPVASVASRCGFGTPETLRQAFVDKYGIPPSRYRPTQQRSS